MQQPILYDKIFDQLTYEEKMLLEENKKSIQDFVEHSSAISNVNHSTRNAHAKTYAVLNGIFKIDKNIPRNIREILDRDKYSVTVRLSNAHLKIKKNDIPAYGFAIKIKDEASRTIANFPLVNFPVFPIKSVSDFLKLFTSVNRFFISKRKGLLPLIKQIFKISPYFFSTEFIKHAFSFLKRKNDFLLSFNYYSVGVYRFGNEMMKIKLKPKNISKSFGKDLPVKESVNKFCFENDFTADVFLKFCFNEKDQPINNLSKKWKNSPYVKVGEIVIHKNSLSKNHCENELLSFNPFESAEMFSPVGKIQKLREETYKVSLQTRKRINKLLKYQ
ncbi:catalase [Chryseobacterium sp. Leaf180]|uniref:catalase n=1 Tax=Chryseobacterium sp. Leaf180 TaxID=1736289 RepID=UPI0007011EB1|nr:catalase [Chryseobacterium sp. Leaf180]KQR92700.1 catalase [Chryseobacterium sp. Leaf180]